MCDVCEANPGDCEHTKEEPYALHLKGLPEIKGYTHKQELFHNRLVETKPYEIPQSKIFGCVESPDEEESREKGEHASLEEFLERRKRRRKKKP